MKQLLLEQILLLTIQQSELLEKEDIAKFEALIHQKQVMMDEVDVLDKENPPTEQEKEGYKSILVQILKVDKMNREKFDKILKETKLEMQKIKQGQRANNLYTQHYDRSMEEGMFIDKR